MQFMASHELTVRETVPASRKLNADQARELLRGMNTLIVAKGKKSETWSLKSGVTDVMVDAMLGPTGNLRAPTVRSGKTVLVGFGEEAWSEVLG
jgi:arsenate reductase-like glutaredoxin family protein